MDAGPMSGLMKKAVNNLTGDDILAISAYVASQAPQHPLAIALD